jgi:hypothetical protein
MLGDVLVVMLVYPLSFVSNIGRINLRVLSILNVIFIILDS